jgi:hypothetical protein
MTISRSQMLSVIVGLVLLGVTSWLVDAGMFTGEPKPEAIFGTWIYDPSDAATRAEALAERLRAQGAGDAAIKAMVAQETASLQSHATVVVTVTDGNLRVSAPTGQDRSFNITFQPFKPDCIAVTSTDGKIQLTFRVLGRHRLNMLQQSGPPIPLQRQSSD